MEYQKDDIHEYCKGRSTKKCDRGVNKHYIIRKWDQSTKKLISSAVTKNMKEKVNQGKEKADDDEKIWSYIISII